MKNTVKAWLYELPSLLLLLIIFVGGIYAQLSGAYKFSRTGAFVFFILLILAIIIMFFVGKYYDNKKDAPF